MKTFCIILIVSLFAGACNNASNQNAEVKDSAARQEDHSHESDEAIQLNSGKKWKVDDAMLVHIRNIERIVTDTAGPVNYVEAGDSIATHLELLTSSCTMTGQAHDELHKWLLPFLDLSEQLSEQDGREAAATLNEMKTAFSVFNTYFE